MPVWARRGAEPSQPFIEPRATAARGSTGAQRAQVVCGQSPAQSFSLEHGVVHWFPPPNATQTPSATPSAPQSASTSQVLVLSLRPGQVVERSTHTAAGVVEST